MKEEINTMRTGYVNLPIGRYDELMNTEKNWLNSCIIVFVNYGRDEYVKVNFGANSEKAKEDFRSILAEVKAEFDKRYNGLRERNERLHEQNEAMRSRLNELTQIEKKSLWKKLFCR